jgi:hypothetical protein
MSGHVVLPVEPCEQRQYVVPFCAGPDGDYGRQFIGMRCQGCLRDGTRAVADDAVPVEQIIPEPGTWIDEAWVGERTWREVTR